MAGITLAVTTESISERLLSSLHFREIAVTTTALGGEEPAWKKPPTSVELTIDDLARARSVTQAVRYAYTAEDTSFHVEPIGDPRPRLEEFNGVKVTRDFFAARELQAAAGSLFTPDDLERGDPVMVVGAELGATLFDDGVALDRDFVANLRRYRIIGVLERSRTEVDEQAFVPAGFLRENYRPSGGDGITVGMVLFEHDRKQSLRFVVGDRTLLDEAREQLSAYFGATYGDGALKISDPRAEALAIADRYRRLVRVILFLAVSALLIATLNMSNIFASRALRRRRAAGILKAMGAARARVFAVFLLDALVAGAIGSAAGVGLAALLARLMEREFGVGGLDPGLIVAGVAAFWIVVAACSVLPAVAAARAPAAEAIRYE